MNAQHIFIRGAISTLPTDQQEAIRAVAEEIRAIIEKNGENGMMALALIGSELAD